MFNCIETWQLYIWSLCWWKFAAAEKEILFVCFGEGGGASDMFLTRICSDETDHPHHSHKPPEKRNGERM